MQRHDYHSAVGTMPFHRSVEPISGITVEPGARFVEQPKRRRRQQQPGESDAPPLPGGKPATGHFGQSLDAEVREGLAYTLPGRGVATPKHRPGLEVLDNTQGGLYRVGVPDEADARPVQVMIPRDVYAIPRNVTIRDRQKPRKHPQQAGLAGTVPSDQYQCAAASQGK